MREPFVPVFYDEKSSASSQYANTIQGIRSAAGKYGMRLQLLSDAQFDTVDFSALPAIAIVTGVSMPFIQKAIARLRENDRYAVLAGTDSEQFGHDVSCATPSRRTETQQLINYLYNCGKKKIALVGFGVRSINDTFRYHAAMSAIAAWGILQEKDVWRWEREPMDSFRDFARVAREYDAVVCPNDTIAIYLVEYLKQQGIAVPGDLFVASFGNMAIGRYHSPSITSMTMDMLYVGEQAFSVWRYLMKSEQSLQRIALKITVPSKILIRESTANMPVLSSGGAHFASPQDYFYHNPAISRLIGLEKCISQRDPVDMQILRLLMARESYEQISEELFISSSTLRYRLNKIYADAGVKGRYEFEALIRESLGADNPFALEKSLSPGSDQAPPAQHL